MGSDGVFSDRVASPRIGTSIIDGLHTYYFLHSTVQYAPGAVLCCAGIISDCGVV
jgi:hypothetical protein